MGTLKFRYTQKTDAEPDEYWLSKSNFKRFNSSLLGLGDILRDKESFEGLAAIFDLEGFTSFCNQTDPHLVVPEYLKAFLNWLFQRISEEFFKEEDKNQVVLFGQLPFFAKFLGDGVLFLWDARSLTREALPDIVGSLRLICFDYEKTFYPKIKKRVTKPPTKLRCGIARGQIISIGDENDFVGFCINIASRLQKLKKFSFAFSQKGLGVQEYWHKDFRLIKVPVRGVSKGELVYVLKSEFNALPEKEKKKLLP